VICSVAWSGFVLTRTALDPNRSERLAAQVFDNTVLRQLLIGRIADSLEAVVPGDVAIPRQILEQAAATALDDPDVENLVRGGIVGVHRSALEGDPQPVTIDAAALGSASRRALVEVRPELDPLLPQSPVIEVELPVGGLSVLGTLRSFTLAATRVLAAVGIVGILLAFIISNRRPAMLRRVAYWAFGTALFWIVVGYGVPFLAERLAPSSVALVAAVVDVFFGAMIAPGIVMAAIGAAMLGASFLLAAGEATAGSRILQPSRPRQAEPTAGRARLGSQQSNIRQAARPATPGPAHRAPAPQYQAPTPRPHHTQPPDRLGPSWDGTGTRPEVDPTSVMPTPQPATPPRWIAGVGYVDENGVPLPPT
jgi:hypothetical protein